MTRPCQFDGLDYASRGAASRKSTPHSAPWPYLLTSGMSDRLHADVKSCGSPPNYDGHWHYCAMASQRRISAGHGVQQHADQVIHTGLRLSPPPRGRSSVRRIFFARDDAHSGLSNFSKRGDSTIGPSSVFDNFFEREIHGMTRSDEESRPSRPKSRPAIARMQIARLYLETDSIDFLVAHIRKSQRHSSRLGRHDERQCRRIQSSAERDLRR
jgi:hypothetical protein